MFQMHKMGWVVYLVNRLDIISFEPFHTLTGRLCCFPVILRLISATKKHISQLAVLIPFAPFEHFLGMSDVINFSGFCILLRGMLQSNRVNLLKNTIENLGG